MRSSSSIVSRRWRRKPALPTAARSRSAIASPGPIPGRRHWRCAGSDVKMRRCCSVCVPIRRNGCGGCAFCTNVCPGAVVPIPPRPSGWRCIRVSNYSKCVPVPGLNTTTARVAFFISMPMPPAWHMASRVRNGCSSKALPRSYSRQSNVRCSSRPSWLNRAPVRWCAGWVVFMRPRTKAGTPASSPLPWRRVLLPMVCGCACRPVSSVSKSSAVG